MVGRSIQGSGSNRAIPVNNNSSNLPGGTVNITPGTSSGKYWAKVFSQALHSNPEFYGDNPGSKTALNALVGRLNGDLSVEDYKQQQQIGLGQSLAKNGTETGKELGQNLIDLGSGNISQEEFNIRKSIQEGQYLASSGTEAGKIAGASVIGQATGELTPEQAQQMRANGALNNYGLSEEPTQVNDDLLALTTGQINQDEYNRRRGFGNLSDSTIAAGSTDSLTTLSPGSGAGRLSASQTNSRTSNQTLLLQDNPSPLRGGQIGPSLTTTELVTRYVGATLQSVESLRMVGLSEAKETSIIENVPSTSYFNAALGRFVDRKANGTTTYI